MYFVYAPEVSSLLTVDTRRIINIHHLISDRVIRDDDLITVRMDLTNESNEPTNSPVILAGLAASNDLTG